MEVTANDHWKLIVLHTNDSHGQIQPFPVVTKDISSQLRLCDQSAPIHNLGGFAYLALKRNRYYRTVINQLMVEGGHKYTSLKNAVKTRKLPTSDLDLIKMWFKLFPTTTASSQGWSNPSSIEDYNIVSKNCFLP